jgi:hypothetical protein
VVELGKFIVNLLRELWPFNKVEPWEKGVYVIWGKPLWVVGPGIWPVIPWFSDVWVAPTVPYVMTTPALTNLTEEGEVTGVGIIQLRIVDIWKAILSIEDYSSNIGELVTGVVGKSLSMGGDEAWIAGRINLAVNPFGIVCERFQWSVYSAALPIRLIQDPVMTRW